MANFMSCLKLLLYGFEKSYAHEGQGRKKGISLVIYLLDEDGELARRQYQQVDYLSVYPLPLLVLWAFLYSHSSGEHSVFIIFSQGNENSAITIVFYSAIVVVTIIICSLRKA